MVATERRLGLTDAIAFHVVRVGLNISLGSPSSIRWFAGSDNSRSLTVLMSTYTQPNHQMTPTASNRIASSFITTITTDSLRFPLSYIYARVLHDRASHVADPDPVAHS